MRARCRRSPVTQSTIAECEVTRFYLDASVEIIKLVQQILTDCDLHPKQRQSWVPSECEPDSRCRDRYELQETRAEHRSLLS